MYQAAFQSSKARADMQSHWRGGLVSPTVSQAGWPRSALKASSMMTLASTKSWEWQNCGQGQGSRLLREITVAICFLVRCSRRSSENFAARIGGVGCEMVIIFEG